MGVEKVLVIVLEKSLDKSPTDTNKEIFMLAVACSLETATYKVAAVPFLT